MSFERSIMAASVALFASVFTAAAQKTPGAIFTTVVDGSEVNYNIYPSKDAVYLDGGPGPGAPQTAAGLNDGLYYFQVTDPPGKTLLSTDNIACREFQITNGVIAAYTPGAACTAPHNTGLDIDHNAVTIQLIPYNDTPNPGGEYKVWATLVKPSYSTSAKGNKFGFVPSLSKTDNFKVGGTPLELDSRFIGLDGNFIDGYAITHTDPLGGSDVKWSYLNVALDINHEAHVESVENGFHQIQIANQPGCNVGQVLVAGVKQGTGPMTVTIHVTNQTPVTTFIDVYCQ